MKNMASRFIVSSFLICSLFISACSSGPSSSNENTSREEPTSSIEVTSSEELTTSEDSSIEEENNLLYRLDFNDDNIGKNVALDSQYEDAEVIGNDIYLESDKHKDNGILAFDNTKKKSSYLSLPLDVLNNDVITITSWVYLPDDLGDFNNNSPLFSIGYIGGHFYTSPFDVETWFGYSMYSKLKGEKEKNLTLAKASMDCAWQNTPTSGTLQSLAGGWQLIGFTFSHDGLDIYQNGKYMLHFDGEYSLKDKEMFEFCIGYSSFSTSLDYNGKISDFRIYNIKLDENTYKEEYKLTYEDFLTTDFEFNGSLDDEVRGFIASKNGNAKYDTKDGKDVVYLDGSQTGGSTSSRTSLTLPNQILIGHNEITISTDLYLVNSQDRYQRVFEFSIKGRRYFALFVGFSDTNDLKLEYVPDNEKPRHIALKSGYEVPTERWINITVTASKDYGRIYVDGVLIAEGEEYSYDPVIMYYYPDLTCTIGRTDFYNDKPLSAYIDNFKMFSIALTDIEVMELNGVINIKDDEEAVKRAMDQFELEYVHDTLLNLKDYSIEGVKLSYQSNNADIVDIDGKIYPNEVDNNVKLIVTFSRGGFSMDKEININVPRVSRVKRYSLDTRLDEVTYEALSYYDDLMNVNLDYLMSLDVERLLYNYRLNAGLDTKGKTSYNGWISTSSGGAGQFEAQYIGALARYTLTKPNYVSLSAPNATNTPLKRLTYMLQEIRKCQVAYGERYSEQKGYLSAFTHLCMKAIESGTSSVTGGDGIHGTIPIGGVNAWVPFYMYHKQLMMCYDVYTYVNDNEVRELALTMLKDGADWVYKEISSLDETQRANTLSFEYGGMTEVMYLTYQITNNPNYLKVARFFEQESLLNSLYENKNCLAGIHTNTTIPKILGCAIAYEVTGNEYYRTICENFWHMIKDEMSYANGGVSKDEHFEEPGVTSQCCYGEETCCSYNMMMLTNYLYRWSGKSSYIDYFENLFYNHIMASIDPETAGKTYPNPTNFGYHKIYSEAIDAFWCCCCTGQETFSKLVYGNIHQNEEATFIDLYNPISYKMDNDNVLTISGNLIIDEKVTIKMSKIGDYNLKLRKPSWTTPILKMNGEIINYTVDENGYIELNRHWHHQDVLEVELPMTARLVEQRGSANSYALFYGPIMLVADLGQQAGDIYISTNQSNTYKNGNWVYFDGAYKGDISQTMLIDNFSKDSINDYIVKKYVDDKLVIEITANNQKVSFIPWMDCHYDRYSMYMYYLDSSITDQYQIEGTKVEVETTDSSKFTLRKENTSNTSTFAYNGIYLNGGEQKVIYNDVNLSGNYEIGMTIKPVNNNQIGGGLYIGVSNPNNGLDKITALNVHLEKTSNSDSYNLMIYKFDQAYLGCIGQAAFVCSNEVHLKVIVKDSHLYVFINGEITPRIALNLDSSLLTGQFGIRNQASSIATYSDIYYKN